MKLIQKKSRSEQVEDYIRNEIIKGNYQPGTRIEPVRKLVKKLGISHVTAATALKHLAEDGWIESKGGKGSFIKAKPPAVMSNDIEGGLENRRKTVYNFFSYEQVNAPFYTELQCSLHDEIERFGWNLKISLRAPEKIIEARNNPDTIGIIMFYGDMDENYDWNVPVVAFGMEPWYREGCNIGPDNYQGGFQAGKLLVEKDLKEVTFVTAPTKDNSGWYMYDLAMLERYRGLADCFSTHGLNPPQQIPWNLPGKVTKEVKQLLLDVKSGKKDHLNLVVANRVMATEICQMMSCMELELKRDVSIITFIRRGGMDSTYPLSTFDCDWKSIGYQMAQALYQLINNNSMMPSRIQMPMFFKDEGSI